MIKSFLKYHIKDRYVLARQARILKRGAQPPLLIFTMAKVGSLSVYQSLKKAGVSSVFHIHTLNKEEVIRGIKKCFDNGIYPGSRSPVILLNQALQDRSEKIKVVSIFRNPVERNISAFFDAFTLHMGVAPQDYKGDLETIEKAFHKKLQHNYAIDWYDSHFKEALGLDVYQYSFDTQKQYAILSNDIVEVLLLDSRLNDTKKEELIQDFCAVPNFQLQNVNVTSQAKHANLYADFKEYVRFRESYLNHQLDSKYTSHFFTQEDRQALKKKWTSR